MNDLYKYGGIYRITDTITGFSYIGQTGNSFGERWSHHRALLRQGTHSNKSLQSAWNADGEDAFEFAIIEVIEGKDALNNAEVRYIAEYRKEGKCFNITGGGDQYYWTGKHLTEETKRKIGEKNRLNMLGRKFSEETRRKMSVSQKNRKYTDEERRLRSEKSRQTNTGRVRSDETKALLRKINQENPPGAKFTPDDIRAIRSMRSSGSTLVEIANVFGTSPSYVDSIVKRRRWAHIE